MAFDRSRRPSDPRQAAEAAFKAATTKPPEVAKPAAVAPVAGVASAAVPGAREMVSLRLDRAVLEHFQKDGPGWQDRINAALKSAAGL
ncbi:MULTISPECIES: BrnA antitoxin family protein [unclassified Methylobacterium]|uniref:BrnA antitoxin family protein n=1 Tax=unclassified Methylobacterium TaxID=2615210 RepID=UPI0006F43E64|nr:MULTISPECIES: BrnA antitoxin family protein [unclassified Methylobacterium]KQP82571.1 hypothetical protein ASF57_10285 [Methylobacterium sp. Leaf117]KQP93050.1 hypothetical protein ASF60_15965 [Methylobacterium sp. Leaf113]MCK2053055.1 BrnA antitoxin family protein [Methylobacterium sp. 37f]